MPTGRDVGAMRTGRQMPQSNPRAAVSLFSPVEVPRTVDAVIDQIADLIRVGKVPQGQMLPGERQLAAALGVSRRTLRDALEILGDAGVLSVVAGPGGGTRVASVWVPDLTDPQSPLETEHVFMILEARRALEPRVAQLAALRGTEEDFAAMRETLALQRATPVESQQYWLSNARFHRQMWRASGNRELELAMRSIYRKLQAVVSVVDDEPISVRLDLHDATLAAIMRGDPDEIEDVMDDHFAHLERLCEITYGRARIRRVPAFLIPRSKPAARSPEEGRSSGSRA
jgi:GntR family transcriptional regulator, transcriptional repressor for pyruvate dehydrogenase complex